MGAAFSPTVVNIFMSVILRRFLRTQRYHPLLLKRYIDDIIIIWTESQLLDTFLTALNDFHPSLHYIFSFSTESTDFLDLTIYKGPHFQCTHHLDTRTFQKPQNLYQYLHFDFCHHRSVHKGIILTECVRYARTNTSNDNYIRTLHLFKTRLQARNYPPEFVNKTTALVSYDNRQKYLQQSKPERARTWPPLFKCIPPPQLQMLKQIILHYSMVQRYVPHPRFIPL